jgi:hypothetical protein
VSIDLTFTGGEITQIIVGVLTLLGVWLRFRKVEKKLDGVHSGMNGMKDALVAKAYIQGQSDQRETSRVEKEKLQ